MFPEKERIVWFAVFLLLLFVVDFLFLIGDECFYKAPFC